MKMAGCEAIGPMECTRLCLALVMRTLGLVALGTLVNAKNTENLKASDLRTTVH